MVATLLYTGATARPGSEWGAPGQPTKTKFQAPGSVALPWISWIYADQFVPMIPNLPEHKLYIINSYKFMDSVVSHIYHISASITCQPRSPIKVSFNLSSKCLIQVHAADASCASLPFCQALATQFLAKNCCCEPKFTQPFTWHPVTSLGWWDWDGLREGWTMLNPFKLKRSA